VRGKSVRLGFLQAGAEHRLAQPFLVQELLVGAGTLPAPFFLGDQSSGLLASLPDRQLFFLTTHAFSPVRSW
jgi:hypothetical protein